MLFSAYNMRRKKIIVIIAMCLFPLPALAAQQPMGKLAPLNFRGIYDFGYGALTFGKAGVEISQTPESYDMTSDITSTGIVNAFMKHVSHTTATGKGSDFHYATVNYEAHYETKGKKKYAHMIYKDGSVAEEKVLPPDDREKRPAVSKAVKDGSYDPLSLVLAMRQGLYDAMQQGKKSYVVSMYDGRRLYQLTFAVVGEKTYPINGTPAAVVQVDVSRRLLEGFTQSELADANVKKDPPLHIYFSHDERLVPLMFEAPLLIGSVHATLAHECAKGESCLFGLGG